MKNALTPTFFLDVDGVLNRMPETWKRMQALKLAHPIEPAWVDMICDLAEAQGAQIVVSSTWRKNYNRAQFADIFGERMRALLAPGKQWCTGADRSGFRGNEVLDWLDTNGWRPFVVFDDDSDFYRWMPVAYCDNGLTADNIEVARQLLVQQLLDGVRRHGIRYRFGDCLNAPETIVAHGCNAKGAMGSGFAKAVITRYPKNLDTYKRWHQERGLQLGSVVWHRDFDTMLNMDRLIANAITQPTYGYEPGVQHVDYEAVQTSLTSVGKVAIDNNWNSVAIPQIGAALGGGDWEVLEDIVEGVGLDLNILFVVYILDDRQYYNTTHDYISKARAARDQFGRSAKD